MSPTEHDLRAALSDGEGDGVDADRLIASARARQAQRRMRMLSTAAVVVVAAGAGTGIVALARAGGGSANGSDKAASFAGPAAGAHSAAHSARSAVSPTAAAGGVPDSKENAAPAGCPAQLPRYALPGGGSPGQFGADGPLFSRPVQTVVVCSYPAPGSSRTRSATAPTRVTLTGSSATRLALSLNATPPATVAPCPNREVTGTRELAIIGLAADGTALRTVTVTRAAGTCADLQATNGTAVRYNWTPPSELLPLILTPARPPKEHGSPISS